MEQSNCRRIREHDAQCLQSASLALLRRLHIHHGEPLNPRCTNAPKWEPAGTRRTSRGSSASSPDVHYSSTVARSHRQYDIALTSSRFVRDLTALPPEKLLLILRDGRKIFGVLRSWDQFANLVLTSTVERYFATTSLVPGNPPRNLFADLERGTYLVRGENVLMLGEVDLDKDDDPPPGYVKGDITEVFALKKGEEALRKIADKAKGRRVGELWGGELENSGEVLF